MTALRNEIAHDYVKDELEKRFSEVMELTPKIISLSQTCDSTQSDILPELASEQKNSSACCKTSLPHIRP